MDSNAAAKPNLQKRHSLQLSQSVTPLPYTLTPTVSDVSTSTPNGTERSRSRHRKQSQLQSNKFRASKQIPFIQEVQSTKSGNSTSSYTYPSILALQPSFTNQATTHEHMSMLSPIHSPAAAAAERTNKKHVDPTPPFHDQLVAAISAIPQPNHRPNFGAGEDDDNTWVASNLSPQSRSQVRSRASRSNKTKTTHAKTSSKTKSKSNSNTNIDTNAINSNGKSERKATSNNSTQHGFLSPNKSAVFASPQQSSSMYDHEDAFDPPQSGFRFSGSSAASTAKVPNGVGVGVGANLGALFPKIADPNRRWLQVQLSDEHKQQQHELSVSPSKPKSQSYDARGPVQSPSFILRQKQKQKGRPHATETRNSLRTSNDSASTIAKKHKHASLIITSNKKNKAVDIRRPRTSHLYIGGGGDAHPSISPVFRYGVIQPSDDHSSDGESRLSNTSSRSSFTTVSRTSTATNTINSQHLRSTSNVYNAKRKPVTIIRRTQHSGSALQPNANDIVRASSSIDYKMHLRLQQQNKYQQQLQQQQQQQQQQKFGLFDGVYCNVDAKNANKAVGHLTESELLERDRFFREAKHKSLTFDESETSATLYRETSPQSMNIDDKLSSIHNVEHSLCKKEIHDAYERGFLAGYFLGVNIMQQQNK